MIDYRLFLAQRGYLLIEKQASGGLRFFSRKIKKRKTFSRKFYLRHKYKELSFQKIRLIQIVSYTHKDSEVSLSSV